MQIQCLSIAPKPIHNCCNNHQLILRHEISYTPLMLGGVVLRISIDVEFEGEGGGRKDEEEQVAQEPDKLLHGK